MAKEDMIEVEGTVIDALPNAMFSVEIPGGHKILAALIENPDRVNAVMNILDLELSEEETLAQVARLK